MFQAQLDREQREIGDKIETITIHGSTDDL